MAGNCALLPDVMLAQGSLVRLIYVPINPTLPPPMHAAPDFGRHWRRHLAWAREATQERGMAVDDWVYSSMAYHFLAQCSLSQVEEMLVPSGFVLLFVEHLYAVFAPAHLAPALLPEGRGHVRAFEAWRAGWFCSPLARGTLLLEQRAEFDAAWLGLGALPGRGRGEAAAAAAVCEWLRRQGLSQDGGLGRGGCDDVEPADLAEFPPSEDVHPALALRRRVQWSLEMEDPLPGLGYHLARSGAAAADVGADVGSCGPRARQVVAQAGQRILHLKGPLHAPPQCQCRVHVLGRRKLREVRRLDVVAAAPPQPPVLREALPPQPLADRRRGRGLAPAPTGQRAQAEPSGVELRTLLQEERAAGQGRAEPAGAPSLECPDMPSALGQQRRGQVRGREDRVQVLDEQQYKATRHKHLLDLRQRALRQEVIGH
mmetsp:Transcript_63859/g.207528  ORF Transcript_63859/g.207528 Transcript_63859/m.207528 type:complete len:428 (-) Transcript_63859:1819-3102(-)